MLDALTAWANGGALLTYAVGRLDSPALVARYRSNEAWNEVAFTTASIALSFSVVRSEPTLNQAKRARVVAWLDKVASKLIDEKMPFGRPADENGMRTWRGLAAAATGVVSADDKLFRWGLSQYRNAIDQLDDDGAWPLEMDRGPAALHGQDEEIAPLVLIAELASRQGVDLYPYEKHGRTLRTAIFFLMTSLADPAALPKRVQQPQTIDITNPEAFDWLEFYNARFNDPELATWLIGKTFAVRLAGSGTLCAASAQ